VLLVLVLALAVLVLALAVLELVLAVLELVLAVLELVLAVLELVLAVLVLAVLAVEFVLETKFVFDVPLPLTFPELEAVELLVGEEARLIVEGIAVVIARAEVNAVALSRMEFVERGSIAPMANSRTSATAIPAKIVVEIARRSWDELEGA
jgi:hypothetical protein